MHSEQSLSFEGTPQKLGATFYMPDNWNNWWEDFEYYIHEIGTHANIYTFLTKWELEMGRWWRSEQTVEGIPPYGIWRSRINWYLNEVQATISGLAWI